MELMNPVREQALLDAINAIRNGANSTTLSSESMSAAMTASNIVNALTYTFRHFDILGFCGNCEVQIIPNDEYTEWVHCDTGHKHCHGKYTIAENRYTPGPPVKPTTQGR
jgi:hypothetical protein